MLSVEEIKRACKFADGFDWDDLGLNCNELSCFGWGLIMGLGRDVDGWNLWTKTYYPLFLQRVIEGINRSYHRNEIDECIEVLSDKVLFSTNMCDIADIGIDQAKEQAIKYILGEMK